MSDFNATLLRELSPKYIPVDLIMPIEDITDIFNRITITAFHTEWGNIAQNLPDKFVYDLSIDQEALFSLPGLEGFALVLGGASDPLFNVTINYGANNVVAVDLAGSIRLRFPKAWLKPVIEDGDAWKADPARAYAEIDLSTGIRYAQGEVEFLNPNFTIAPCMIGDTGFVIEGSGVLDVSQTSSLPETIAMGLGTSWRGLVFTNLAFHLPKDINIPIVPEDLVLTNFHIGSGGISGSVSALWSPTISGTSITGNGAGTILGFTAGLKKFQLSFIQNGITNIELTAALKLPFFEHIVDVKLVPSLNGDLLLALDRQGQQGLYTLTKPNVVSITIPSLSIGVKDGVGICKLSGTLTPLYQGIAWPGLDVKELSIDSEGNVHMDGGWTNLPKQYSLEFHGFKMGLTKLGLGQDPDGRKWIGLAGNIRFVEKLAIGGSVDGLRLSWRDDGNGGITDVDLSFDGIGIELKIPDVLYLKGYVGYTHTGNEHRFDGAVQLTLTTPKLSADARVVIGMQGGMPYFALYVGVDLPVGIPLPPTGLSIYGFAGLFALNMFPNKPSAQRWDEWVYQEPYGADQLQKWQPDNGSFGLGAGITIGTMDDNGYKFTAKGGLTILSSVVMITAGANILTDRAKINTDEPMFRALAVVDGAEETFLFGLSGGYKYDSDGSLVDISAAAEAYFAKTDSHVYIGQREPREKRIRARFAQLFEASAYLMIDADGVQSGFACGFDKTWSLGPLSATAALGLEINTSLSAQPLLFHADGWLYGRLALSAFGFGIGISIDAKLAVDTPKPTHIWGSLTATLELPSPLPDLSFSANLDFGLDDSLPPAVRPLKEISIVQTLHSQTNPANGSQHGTYSLAWLPVIKTTTPDVLPTAPLPHVPLDAYSSITFNRRMFDKRGIGANGAPVADPGWERIGNPVTDQGPAQAHYTLDQIELHKQVGTTWVEVAATKPNQNPDTPLYGAWQVLGPQGSALDTTSLKLWARSSFDYICHTDATWQAWITENYPNFPCLEGEHYEFCWQPNYADIPGAIVSPWACPSQPFELSWGMFDPTAIYEKNPPFTEPPANGMSASLPFYVGLFEQRNEEYVYYPFKIHFKIPASSVKLVLWRTGGHALEVLGYDAAGNVYPRSYEGSYTSGIVEIGVDGDGIVDLTVGYQLAQGSMPILMLNLLSICATVGSTQAELAEIDAWTQYTQEAQASWEPEGDILEPYTIYRLAVTTTAEVKGLGMLAGKDTTIGYTDYAYFQTGGPPGIADLTLPNGATLSKAQHNPDPSHAEEIMTVGPNGQPVPTAPDALAGKQILLDRTFTDLTPYVQQTIPPTVTPAGQPPRLFRPVYRAQDIGVQFNVAYIDLMYALAKRDIGIHLFDNNSQPVRDMYGRPIILANQWGDTGKTTLNYSESVWQEIANNSECCPDLPPQPFDKQVNVKGSMLKGDATYQARVIPMLLHDSFSTYGNGAEATTTHPLGHWEIVDDQGVYVYGGVEHSHWQVQFVQTGDDETWQLTQLTTLRDDMGYGKWGANLVWYTPEALAWTDYRFSAYVRTDGDDPKPIGLDLRATQQGWYRFYIDHVSSPHGWLVRINDGQPTTWTVLANVELSQAGVTHLANTDYLITMEAEDARIRVFINNMLMIEVEDPSPAALNQGTIGLYCSNNDRAIFKDVRVDDLRPTMPIAYQFSFTTSKYANFFHHLHTYRTETWTSLVSSALLKDTMLDAAMQTHLSQPYVQNEQAPSQVPSINADEHTWYLQIASAILGQQAYQDVSEVQVTLIQRDVETSTMAILFQSPEPIFNDTARIAATMAYSNVVLWPGSVAKGCVLAEVSTTAGVPEARYADLILREPTNLTGYRLAWRTMPQTSNQDALWNTYYTFGSEEQLAAGVRLRVYGGNQASPLAAPATTLLRFGNAETGDVPLGETALELRLVAPDGQIVHQRSFLPQSAYTEQPLGVLRKADGTGAILVVQNGGYELATGTYQLRLTYFRQGGLLLPLKEAGQTSPEEVRLDIPVA